MSSNLGKSVPEAGDATDALEALPAASHPPDSRPDTLRDSIVTEWAIGVCASHLPIEFVERADQRAARQRLWWSEWSIHQCFTMPFRE